MIPHFISRLMRSIRFRSHVSAQRHFRQLMGSFFYSRANAEQNRFEAAAQARKQQLQRARNLAVHRRACLQGYDHKRSMIGRGKNTLAGIPA